MRALIFTIVGVTGIILLLFSGNRLLHHPKVNSYRFSYSLAGLFAIFLFILTLISRDIDIGSVILACILSGINFGIGYPILIFVHHYYISNKDR